MFVFLPLICCLMFAFLARTNGAVYAYLCCSSDFGVLSVKDQLSYPPDKTTVSILCGTGGSQKRSFILAKTPSCYQNSTAGI